MRAVPMTACRSQAWRVARVGTVVGVNCYDYTGHCADGGAATRGRGSSPQRLGLGNQTYATCMHIHVHYRGWGSHRSVCAVLCSPVCGARRVCAVDPVRHE